MKINSIASSWEFALTEDSVRSDQLWILKAMKFHGSGLVNMLWRILGNEDDVCDAYQQVFLNLAHNNTIKKPKNIKAYLYRTASNTAVSMLRRRKIKTSAIEKIASRASRHHCVDYAGDLDAKALRKKLRNALTNLPDYLRQVVILRELAEMDYNTISSILGISASTARVYRLKAVKMLSNALKPNQEGQK